MSVTMQDRAPNFRAGTGNTGRLYLVRCFACDERVGRENYALAVAAGVCAWCGWSERSSAAMPGGGEAAEEHSRATPEGSPEGEHA